MGAWSVDLEGADHARHLRVDDSVGERETRTATMSRWIERVVVGSSKRWGRWPSPRIRSTSCGPSAGPYRWEFEKNGEALAVDVRGPLIADSADLMIRAALDGLGLTFSFEEYVAPHIKRGALVRVLEDWCPPFAVYFLYYPSKRQQSPALAALIETLRV